MPTTVSFQLPDPAFEDYTWEYESEHNPGSHPPLTLDMPGMEGGLARDGVPQSIKVNGYGYWRVAAPGPPFNVRSLPRAPQETPLERWREFWLPRVDAVREELLNFEPRSVPAGTWRSTIEEMNARFGETFAGVHVSAVIAAATSAERFVDSYASLFGEGRASNGRALLQGFANQTSMRATELWELSRGVRSNDTLRRDLEAWHAGTPLPRADGFAEAFDASLARWGETIDRHLQDLPSWQEDPAPVVAMLLGYASQDDSRGPAATEEAAAARRRELEAELRTRAANDEAFLPLLQALPVAQQMIVVGEDHNVLCDQRLTAASRVRWLAVGRYLRERMLVDDAADVFYHTPGELFEALERGVALPRATIAERRRLQAAYRAAIPPARLGNGYGGVRTTTPTAMVRGRPASPGRHQGTARVARTLQDASSVGPGDVLVCTMTAPAWTPFFGIAGAVVTDAGGALSHAAIVAREFGIPAVVGTATATQDIPDGATVLVDGTAGTVEVVGEGSKR